MTKRIDEDENLKRILAKGTQPRAGTAKGGFDIYGSAGDPGFDADMYNRYLLTSEEYARDNNYSPDMIARLTEPQYGDLQDANRKNMIRDGYWDERSNSPIFNRAPSLGATGAVRGNVADPDAILGNAAMRENTVLGSNIGDTGIGGAGLSGNKGFGLNSDNIVAGSQFIDNIANLVTQDQARRVPTPRMGFDPTIDLDTDFDINPALAAGRASEAAVNKGISESGVSAQTANASAIMNRRQTLANEGTLYGQKANIETNLVNQERMANAEVDARNRAKMDQYNQVEFQRRMESISATQANFVDIQKDIQYLVKRSDMNNYQNMSLLVTSMKHPETMGYLIRSGLMNTLLDDPTKVMSLREQLAAEYAKTKHTTHLKTIEYIDKHTDTEKMKDINSLFREGGATVPVNKYKTAKINKLDTYTL